MENKYCYIEVKCEDELPEQNGEFVCIFSNEYARYKKEIEFFAGMWCVDEDDETVTHWLKRVPISTLTEQIASDAWVRVEKK